MTTEVGSETEVKESEKVGTNAAKEDAGDAPVDQKEKTSEVEQDSPALQTPASQSSPSRSREGKGISRFIPPWLKKQKSYSLVEPKDEAKKKTLLASEDETEEKEGECLLPEDVAQPKGKLEDVAENQREKEEDKEEEIHSAAQVYIGNRKKGVTVQAQSIFIAQSYPS